MALARSLGFILLCACGTHVAPAAQRDTIPQASFPSPAPIAPDAAITAQSVDASIADTSTEELRARVLALPLVQVLAAAPLPKPPPQPPQPPPPPLTAGHDRFGTGNTPVAVKLTDGGLRMSQGLPPEVIRRIVRQNFGRFRLCYENAVRSNPDLKKATLVDRFAIAASGAVVFSEPTTDPQDAFPSCVARGFLDLTFPQPEAVSLVAVEFTIGFELSDGAKHFSL